MSVADMLREAAKTTEERGKIYGDSRENFDAIGRTLKGLFPEGVELNTSEQFARFCLVTMLAVKLARYTNNFTKGGHEDSVHDLGVYAFILQDNDQWLKELKAFDESTKETLK